MKIYVLATWDWEDFTVLGLFSTFEKARERLEHVLRAEAGEKEYGDHYTNGGGASIYEDEIDTQCRNCNGFFGTNSWKELIKISYRGSDYKHRPLDELLKELR